MNIKRCYQEIAKILGENRPPTFSGIGAITVWIDITNGLKKYFEKEDKGFNADEFDNSISNAYEEKKGGE